MSLKGLALNREKILEALNGYSPDAKVNGPQEKPNGLKIYTIKLPNQPEATLNVYYLKDGNTTLASTFGQNKEMSEKIAFHVKEQCEYKDISTKPLYLKKVNDDEFDTLIEFLQDYGVKVEAGKNLYHGEQFRIIGPYGDNLVLNKYKNGSFQVQGSAKVLKALVIEALTELLPYKDIIDGQLKSLEVKVTSDEIINQLEQVLPNAYGFLGETLVAIISPAVSLKLVEIELTDYSAFAFPALKGLEGYIKKLFKEKGVVVGKDGFGEYFESSVKVKLVEEIQKQLNDNKIAMAIESSYSYYRRHRHSLFHVDGHIETTRNIETKKEAEEITEDVLKIIEETYTAILAK